MFSIWRWKYICLEFFFSKGKMQSISSLCERVFKNMQETLNCTENNGSPSYFWLPERLNRTWLCKLIFKWEKRCSQRHRAVSQSWTAIMHVYSLLFSHLIWLHVQSWSNITSGDKGQGIWVLGLADLCLSVYWSLGGGHFRVIVSKSFRLCKACKVVLHKFYKEKFDYK